MLAAAPAQLSPATCTRLAGRHPCLGRSTSRKQVVSRMATPSRTLVAFDFDHTVINANSDTEIYKALAGGQLPADVHAKYESGQWTRFMNVVLQHLADQGVTEQQLMQTLGKVQLSPGMQLLLDHLSSHPHLYECIILSDANTLFIQWILQAHNLSHVFSHVCTNPATLTPEGRLSVQPFHQHDCPSCIQTPNLCKTKALKEFLATRPSGAYHRVVYLGDGSNDLCPCLGLTKGDAACPRVGFALHKLLQKPQTRGKVQAQVVEWESGQQVLEWLQRQQSAA